MKKIKKLGSLMTVLYCTAMPVSFAASGKYAVVQKITVPGEGGWDYLTADATNRRLYISHSTQVDVMDMDTHEIVGHVRDTPGVHGIALSSERGFTSNGKEGKVAIFDLKTLAVITRVKVGDNPDAILYDQASKHVFAFNGRSGDVTVIDPASDQPVGRVALEGKPEFAVADGKGLIYDNLEDKSQLVKMDAQTLVVKARWPLAPCEEPSGLAIDSAHNRLFVGCGNKKMAVVDAMTGHVIMTLPIGDHTDATAFDPETAMIFNSNGDGTLTIVHEDSPDAYHVVDTVATQKGARTMALDPKTHKIFLATAQFGPAPAATAAQPRPRPTILPGTFTILVVAKP